MILHFASVFLSCLWAKMPVEFWVIHHDHQDNKTIFRLFIIRSLSSNKQGYEHECKVYPNSMMLWDFNDLDLAKRNDCI